MPDKIAVIIPAFNTAKTIGTLIEKIQKDYPQLDIVVVDDDSADQTFSTTADTTAPQIIDLKAEISALGSGENIKYQAIISWDTDEPSTSQVEYGQGLGGDYSNKSKENLSLNQNHVVILPDLKPNNAYHLRVLSADKSANLGISEDQTLITPPKEKSLLQLILRSLEDTFSWVTKLKGKFGGWLHR